MGPCLVSQGFSKLLPERAPVLFINVAELLHGATNRLGCFDVDVLDILPKVAHIVVRLHGVAPRAFPPDPIQNLPVVVQFRTDKGIHRVRLAS